MNTTDTSIVSIDFSSFILILAYGGYLIIFFLILLFILLYACITKCIKNSDKNRSLLSVKEKDIITRFGPEGNNFESKTWIRFKKENSILTFYLWFI
jgi:hypothetical protein